MENVKPENLQKTQEYIDFVEKNLAPLAEHLKVGVEWLWNILVMQARVEAITHLVIGIVMFAIGIALTKAFIYFYKKKDENGMFGMAIPLVILTVISLIHFAATTQTVVTGLVNPEYRAIEKIIEFSKPKVEEATDGK